MASQLFVIGVSWRTAPVALREKLAFSASEIPDALSEITSSPAVDEALLISTCNRVEVYAVTPQDGGASELARGTAETRSFLARSRGVSAEDIAEAMYERVNADAVSHVFRVAAALDSMVVGESQVLGQLKDAYGTAVHSLATGRVLGRCVERSFKVAKRVRTETGIARGAANVSSVAVELASRVFGELAGRGVLVVGAGKMSALAARHLRRGGASSIRVVNRSLERAERLAMEIDGEARPWDEFHTLLEQADVVISSTGATQPILDKSTMKKIMRRRRQRPIVIVDIAVPRDVEESVGGLGNVYLFDIDDLRKVVDQNLSERQCHAEDADQIVENEVLDFQRWLRSQRAVPTIRSLRDHFSSIAEAETDKVLKQLEGDDSPESRERAIRRLSRTIVNKLLHTPSSALKEGDRDIEQLVRAAEKLFRLDAVPNVAPNPNSEDGTKTSRSSGHK